MQWRLVMFRGVPLFTVIIACLETRSASGQHDDEYGNTCIHIDALLWVCSLFLCRSLSVYLSILCSTGNNCNGNVQFMVTETKPGYGSVFATQADNGIESYHLTISLNNLTYVDTYIHTDLGWQLFDATSNSHTKICFSLSLTIRMTSDYVCHALISHLNWWLSYHLWLVWSLSRLIKLIGSRNTIQYS